MSRSFKYFQIDLSELKWSFSIDDDDGDKYIYVHLYYLDKMEPCFIEHLNVGSLDDVIKRLYEYDWRLYLSLWHLFDTNVAVLSVENLPSKEQRFWNEIVSKIYKGLIPYVKKEYSKLSEKDMRG